MTPAKCDVSGVPAALPEGVDVVAYRVVAEILAAGACTGVKVRFGPHRLGLDFALTGPAGAPGVAVRGEIGRIGGTVRVAAAGPGEEITVDLPLVPVPAGP